MSSKPECVRIDARVEQVEPMDQPIFRVEMLPVRHGDCLLLEYGTSGALNYILIDGGPLDTYPRLRARLACRLAVEAGAAFVKTSTGFHPSGGATVADVRLMRAEVGGKVGVKASGGIRNLADARAMLDAGANRLGTSASAAILAALG